MRDFSVTPIAVLTQKSQELLQESMIHAGCERWGFKSLSQAGAPASRAVTALSIASILFLSVIPIALSVAHTFITSNNNNHLDLVRMVVQQVHHAIPKRAVVCPQYQRLDKRNFGSS
ncbi:MAG: hypothetical protein ACKOBA_00390, partial [Limnohabitans sp.]